MNPQGRYQCISRSLVILGVLLSLLTSCGGEKPKPSVLTSQMNHDRLVVLVRNAAFMLTATPPVPELERSQQMTAAKRVATWFLSHPAWAGISGLVAIIALVMAFRPDKGVEEQIPKEGAPKTAVTSPTQISREKFSESFAGRLGQYDLDALAEITVVKPEEFTAKTAQDIVDSLPPKSLLYLREGTYFLESLSVNQPIIILGENALTTKLIFTKWSLVVGKNSSKKFPCCLVNLSVSYTGNDALMYCIQTEGHTVISHCRIDSPSPFSPWLIQASDFLNLEHCVLTVKENNSAGLSIFDSDLSQSQIYVANNSFVGSGSTNYFALPPVPFDSDVLVILERNIFWSLEHKAEKPKWSWVRSGDDNPESAAEFRFNRNVIAGEELEEIMDLQLGRQDDRTIYMDDPELDENYYPQPGSPLSKRIDGEMIGARQICEQDAAPKS